MVKFGTSGLRGEAVDFDEATVHRYVTAFLETCTTKSSGLVFVGSDLRGSSPLIKEHVCRSVFSSGRMVFDAGILPTPALALWAMHHRAPAIMVTGSHIPADYNGLKFYRADGELRKTDEIRILARVEDVVTPIVPAGPSAVDCHLEALAFYRQRYLGASSTEALCGLRLGVYLHSAAGGDLLACILEDQGASVERFGASVEFVPIDTEALEDDALAYCRSMLELHGLDAVVSTDGDGDRPFILDETGEQINGDVLGLLTSKVVGARSVATPLTSTSAIERSGWFETIVRTAIGSPYVVDAMATPDLAAPVVGFEANGGVLLGSPSEGMFELAPLPTRDAVLPIVATLAMANHSGQSLSELVGQLPQAVMRAGRLKSVPAGLGGTFISRIAQDAVWRARVDALLTEPSSIDTTDGARFGLKDGSIIHFRQSGNAPELRCYVETKAKTQTEDLLKHMLARATVVLDMLAE